MNYLTEAPNLNFFWARLMVEELVRCGVTYFCVAPGSRCAPLSMAVAAHPQAQWTTHLDERALAYHALGYAGAARQPVAVITTSGTAVANCMPAAVEAAKKKVPLIFLTADRPPELQHTGAHQSIDQVKFFGDHVRWQMEMPCPTLAVAPAFVLTTIDQAVSRSQGELPGPVHLNCAFREPLAPVKAAEHLRVYRQPLADWMARATPYTSFQKVSQGLRPHDVLALGQRLQGKAGIIVVGKLADAREARVVLRLAERLQWPVLPDLTSGLRLGCAHPQVIAHFDQLLRHPHLLRQAQPEVVLHLGGRMTSKAYYQWIAGVAPSTYIMALNHPLRSDPQHQVTHRYQGQIQLLCQALGKQLSKRRPTAFLKTWQEAQERIATALDQFFSVQQTLSEPLAARLIVAHLPKDHGLFLANSMSLREVDMFAARDGHACALSANRGASGIDGTLATAVGFSAGLQRPVTVLTGDLAFLYDLNALLMLANLPHAMIIVVFNNRGGGIFSFLPAMRYDKQAVEAVMATPPPEASLAMAAGMVDMDYACVTTVDEFVAAYQGAIRHRSSLLMEVPSDREENFKYHQRLQWRCSFKDAC